MTVTYYGDINTSKWNKRGFGALLWRWTGSIYRILYYDFINYIVSFTIISLVYRLALTEEQKIIFGQLAEYFDKFGKAIPLDFVLGFYCSIVAGRWWSQFQAIPWPDTLCVNVSTIIKGEDEDSRMMRRNIARYANLAITKTFVMVSKPAQKRFNKTQDNFVKEGLLTPNEKKLLDTYHNETRKCKSAFDKDGNAVPLPDNWIPLVWASNIVNKARAEGKISYDLGAKTLLGELASLRSQCDDVTNFAWINLPLVYTQVVTIAVYGYFLTTLIGRQFIENEGIDLYVPLVTLLQFVFYMGWLKTAESLLNPFGDDDDDFDIDELIDRNHEMGYIIVDKMYSVQPELSRDIHWNSIVPSGKEPKVEDLSNRRKDDYVLLQQEPVNGNVAV